MGQPRLERAQDRIEPFYMTDLKNDLPLSREPCQLTRLGRIFGDWFLDEQVFALLDERPRNREVGVGRGCNRSGVNLCGEFA